MLRTVRRSPACARLPPLSRRRLQLAGDIQAATPPEVELSQEVQASDLDFPPRRPERRSPAATFGIKKMPAIQIPSELENKMDRLFGDQDIKATRASYKLFLNSPGGLALAQPFKVKDSHKNLKPTALVKQKPAKKGITLDLEVQPLKLIPSTATPTLVYAHAAGQMPAQYAIMRNVFRELRTRIGWQDGEDGEDGEGGIQIIDWNAGYGPAAWAAMATFPSPPEKKNLYVHIEPNKQVSELSKALLEPTAPGPLQNWNHQHFRSYIKYGEARPDGIRINKSVAVSSFQLSGIRTSSDRRRTLRQMWESDAEIIVVADMASKDSFGVVLEAREYFLKLGEKERLAAREQRKREWAEIRANQAAAAAALLKPSPSTSSTPIAPQLSTTDPSEGETDAPAPRTRGRRRPGSGLPRAFLREVEADKEGDRLEAPGPDGKERFELDGVEYEEITFEEAAISTRTAPVSLASASSSQPTGALVAARPKRAQGCHVVAPCAHELPCPLASTPDFCHFSQLVEQPFFTRSTKNSKVGTAETKMSYFILRRGPRPQVAAESRGEGRIGEVARELLEKERERSSKVLVEGEEGVYEPREDGEGPVTLPPVDQVKLREEAMEWGRIIYAPLIRKDLILADVCASDGTLTRNTYPRSLGRQVWYDMKHSQWGDAVPHTPRSSSVRTRGIAKLAPAHKTNKITIHNGKVTGLQSLSKVEYREVELLMGSLGIELPVKTGRKNRELIMEKRAAEPTGWDSPRGWGIGDELQGYDGSEKAVKEKRAQKTVEKIVRAVGATSTRSNAEEGLLPPSDGNTKIKLKSSKKDATKGEWTLDGGWVPNQEQAEIGQRTPLDLESEWEPTPLVGAQEIDRSDELDERERWTYDDPDIVDPTTLSLADSFTDSSPSSSIPSTPVPGARPFFTAEEVQSSASSSAFGSASLSSSAPIDLAGLGPGWMETHDESAPSSPKDLRAMAKDRTATFKRLGIRIPKGRSRTVKDDWELLESWDAQKSPASASSSSASRSASKPKQEKEDESDEDDDDKPGQRGPSRKKRKPWLSRALVRDRRKDFLRY